MKKEKEKEIEFNPADYDYMDSIPLEGWVWEIIRRSSKYKNIYDRTYFKFDPDDPKYNKFVSNIIKETDILPTVLSFSLEETKKFPTGLKHLFTIFSAENKKDKGKNSYSDEPIIHHKYRIFGGSLNALFQETLNIAKEVRITLLGIPDPNVKYSDFTIGNTPKICGLSPIMWNLDDDRYDEFKSIMSSHDMFQIILPATIATTDIEKVLLPSLKKYLKSRKERIRTDKWKWYLISYVLKQQGLSYGEISDKLIKAYPENKRLFDIKNCENYYKSASSLISGEYKKYLK